MEASRKGHFHICVAIRTAAMLNVAAIVVAAIMAMQTLREAGFGAQAAANVVLDKAPSGCGADFSGLRLCCLSEIEDGASATSIRFFVRRIQRRMPDAAVVIGLRGATGDSPLLATLRSEGGSERIILSISELLAFTRAVSAQAGASLV
jgi:hypothetical protein